jgi:hypothetical protein
MHLQTEPAILILSCKMRTLFQGAEMHLILILTRIFKLKSKFVLIDLYFHLNMINLVNL